MRFIWLSEGLTLVVRLWGCLVANVLWHLVTILVTNPEQRRVAKQRLFAALCRREEITARPPPGGPIAETMWMPSTYLWASIEKGLQLQHRIVLHTVLLLAACSLFMSFFMDWDSLYVPERLKARDSKECGVWRSCAWMSAAAWP